MIFSFALRQVCFKLLTHSLCLCVCMSVCLCHFLPSLEWIWFFRFPFALQLVWKSYFIFLFTFTLLFLKFLTCCGRFWSSLLYLSTLQLWNPADNWLHISPLPRYHYTTSVPRTRCSTTQLYKGNFWNHKSWLFWNLRTGARELGKHCFTSYKQNTIAQLRHVYEALEGTQEAALTEYLLSDVRC